MSLSGSTFYSHYPPRNLEEAIAQVRGGDFKCDRCVNYKGGCGCEMGVLILVVGQDMSMCQMYSPGTKCRHCGRLT
jgi:hypothetical protein